MKSCDVGIMIGQHAMAGVAGGNLNHTQNSREITCTNTRFTDLRSVAPHCKRISDLTFKIESDNILDVLYG